MSSTGVAVRGVNMNRTLRQHQTRQDKNQPGAITAASASRQGSKQQPPPSPTRMSRGRTQAPSNTTAAAAATATPPPPPPLPPPPPPSFAPSWRAIYAEEHGRLYFYNLDTGETTWDPPPQSRGGAIETSEPPPAFNRSGAVTVRSRSSVILSKGGKIQFGRSCSAVSSRSEAPKHPTAAVQKGGRLGTTDELEGGRGRTLKTGTDGGPVVRSTLHGASTLPAKGASSGVEGEGGCQRTRQPPVEKGGDETKRVLGSPQGSVGCPEESTPVPKWSGLKKSTRPRAKRAEEPPTLKPAPSSQGNNRVASSLQQAERWLATNEPESELGRPCRGRGPNTRDQTPPKPDFSLGTRETSGRFATPTHVVEASQKEGAALHEPPAATTARLRGQAAAVQEAIESRRREAEEMTGRPEITRRGRNKQRSVDDLFLFQRNAEASRRRRHDERETHENKLVTGKPETCRRSAVLVKRMRRGGGNDAHLPTSQRLHSDAGEQRRRRDTQQARVETAIRRRANPNISMRSKSLPRERGDIARRLYEQAIASREGAQYREQLSQKHPRGYTFRPEIDQRSALLAQRRRDRWASVGLDKRGRGGGTAVQEFLIAEGTLYDRRRQERQSIQEELTLRRSNPTVNRHSRRLLRAAGKTGRSPGTQSEETRSRASEAVDAEQYEFSPRLEGLDTSQKMLESRYGRDAIPTMEQRAKDREVELLERRRSQSVEQDKENRNFVARRASRRSSASESPEHGRGGDIYERTTEYARRRDSRRASVREVLLAQELVGCTFAPELQARIRGRSRYRQAAEAIANRGSPLSPPLAETSSREERWVRAEDGGAKNRDGGAKSEKGTVYTGLLRGGLPAGDRGRPRQQAKTVVREGGWLSPPPPAAAAAGGVSEEEEGEAEWDDRGDSSVGTDEVDFSSRRQGIGRPQQTKTVVGQGGWLSPSSPAAAGRVPREEAECDGRSDRSAGVGYSGHRQGIGRRQSGGRRSPSEHRHPRQEQSTEGEEQRDGYNVDYEDDNEDLVPRRATVAAVGRVGSGTASRGRRTAGVTGSRGKGGLPPNWASFTSPEGWEYFHNSQTGVVQWKQPTS